MAKSLAILSDYPEEGWPSMDLVAEMLERELQSHFPMQLQGRRVCPPFRRRASKVSGSAAAFNFDRLLNRMRDYPRLACGIAAQWDLFHVCDHSYSQLVHSLPPGRTGVFCHDLDTFRCVLQPKLDRRPTWFRAMTRRILSGLQKAAVVFYATGEVRRQMEQHDLIDPNRLVHAPPGVAPEFLAGDLPVTGLPPEASHPYILHVGSTIARKRIDVLLDVFARVAASDPKLRLIQIGGQWTDAQRQQIERLKIIDRAVQVRGVPRDVLAALYRRARIVLLPSEAEGFGLPLIEALACGAPVLASDIPVLREVGGDAASYCPVGDVDRWVEAVRSTLRGPSAADRSARVARAAQFSWRRHAEIVLQSYLRLEIA
jgi:glycosyltransferase involved in cell wall biosynthesis